MGYIVRTYACECGARFELLQQREDGPPKFCGGCGAEFDSDAEPVPSRIAVGGSVIARSTDSTYRQLEESSAARAAELGAPSLKVTDMHDNLRVGDVAAKQPPDNAVTRFAREAKASLGVNYMSWGGGFASPGARVAPVIPAGAAGGFAGPGHIALAAAQPEHAARVEQIVQHPSHAPYRSGR